MADIELLPTTTLPGAVQEAPISCKNCVGLQKTGQNSGSNGSFIEHLTSLVDQHSDQDSGQQLPKLGNDLPHSFSSLLDQVKTDKLEPLLSKIFPSGSDKDQLSQLLNIDVKLSKQDLLESINSLVSGGVDELQNLIKAELQAAGFVEDGKDILLAAADQPSIVNLPPLAAVNFQQLDSANNILEKTIGLQQDSFQINNPAELAQKAKESFQDKIINDIQAKSVKEYLSDGVISDKALEDSLDFELFNRKPTFLTEQFHQALSTYKTGPNSQYINPVLPDNAGQRINIANSIPTILDVSSPTNLKLNISEGFEAAVQSTEQSLNQNIKWLVNNKIQNARINLYPESLGHVNVSLNLEDTKLTVNFLANSIATKEIIESNLTSLRDHLNESGIDLEEATVDSQFLNHEDQYAQTSKEENESIYTSLSVNEDDLNDQLSIHHDENSLHLVDAYI